MPKRQHPEDAIQIAVADHLRQRGSPGVVFWHTPNGTKLGGKRSKKGYPIQAGRLKRFGVRPGVSDVVAFHQGRMFCLELKAPGNKPTAEQYAFLSAMEEQGAFTAWVDSLDRALAVLEEWKLLQGRAA